MTRPDSDVYAARPAATSKAHPGRAAAGRSSGRDGGAVAAAPPSGLTGTTDDRRRNLEEATAAVTGAARELGHSLHPWGRLEGWKQRTACAVCGMGAEAGLDIDEDWRPYGWGPATLLPCRPR